MRLSTWFSPISSQQRIDRLSGIIYGVSVITEGEARGHGKFIDSKTLEQVLAVAQSHKDGVKVKADHGSGVLAIIGTLKNFRQEASQVRADLHLMREDDDFNKIAEMAEKCPNEFGLSISFTGEDEKVGDKQFARCAELYSVDLVDDPAANPSGLFSKPQNNMMNLEHKATCKALGLPETSTSEQVNEAILKKLSAPPPAPPPAAPPANNEAMTAITQNLEKVTKSLEALQKRDEEREKAAGKAERQALVAQASREGKVVPLSDSEVSEMPVNLLRSLISKLKPEVPLSKRPVTKLDPTKKEELQKLRIGARDRAVGQMTEFFDTQFAKIN